LAKVVLEQQQGVNAHAGPAGGASQHLCTLVHGRQLMRLFAVLLQVESYYDLPSYTDEEEEEEEGQAQQQDQQQDQQDQQQQQQEPLQQGAAEACGDQDHTAGTHTIAADAVSVAAVADPVQLESPAAAAAAQPDGGLAVATPADSALQQAAAPAANGDMRAPVVCNPKASPSLDTAAQQAASGTQGQQAAQEVPDAALDRPVKLQKVHLLPPVANVPS
jgi:hypothetical protein